jgi:hypothetical protein
MKKLCLKLTFLMIFTSGWSQIGELKFETRPCCTVKIFNEEGKYSGNYITGYCKEHLAGYNSEYIVFVHSNVVKVFDYNGKYTGKYKNLYYNPKTIYVKDVTSSAIIIQWGRDTEYYDFNLKLLRRTSN